MGALPIRASVLRAALSALVGERYPYRGHRTMAQVMRDEARREADWPDAPLPDEVQSFAEDNRTADDGSGCEGSTPEGTSGASAEVTCDPANVDQSHTSLPLLPPSGETIRSGTVGARGRVSRNLPVPEARPHPDDDPADDDAAELAERVVHRRAERVEIVTRKPAPKPDWSRLAAAHRAKAAPASAPIARTLPAALSREGCARCGIPGSRGCEHQAPCQDPLIDGADLRSGAWHRSVGE